MKKVLALCAALIVALIYANVPPPPALAAGYTAVCGPPGTSAEANCMKPNSDGSTTASCTASAADPSYSAGANPCSVTLSGYQRVQVPSSQTYTTGTAGTPSSQVLTVQGISSGTAIATTTALAPTSGNGCTAGHTITTVSTNANNITAVATTLCWINATYTTTGSSVAGWIKIIDKASSPTCGSETVKQSLPVSAAPASGLVGGIIPSFGVYGMAFANGFSFCVVGAEADADSSNSTANIMINYGYK